MSAIPGSGFKNGTITLNEPKAIYYSGQEISGTLNFKLGSPVSYLYLIVIYKGEAIVSWTEKEQETYLGETRWRDVKYSGHEEYLNFSQCISGGNAVSVLPSGAHSLHFQHRIPFNAPSSFEDEKGKVSYSITACLVHQDNITKENIIKKFDVVAPLDLNIEEIKKPIHMYFEEVYSCSCFCAGQPLNLSIKAPHSGYAPGQVISFTVEAKNDSSVEVTEIIFEVVKRMRYLSQQPMSAVVPPEEIIVSSSMGPILSKTKRDYVYDFKLPDFIALNFDNCGIIDVGYYLKVTIKLSGCNDDVLDEVEVCMGLVPIGSNLDVKATHPMANCLPNAPIPNPESQPHTNELINYHQVQTYATGPNLNVYPGANIYGSKNSVSKGFMSNQMNQNISHSDPFLPFPNLPEGQFALLHGQSGSQAYIHQSPPPPYSAQPPSPFSPSAPPPS